NFPPPFAEWNDHFRDAARRFWLPRNLTTGEFACRFAASSDVFLQVGEGELENTLSGAGSLVKTGTGELTLSGDNSYSGGTTISD
ncbi:autotransporter-associated beta strand repeat-containing protein, partial [Salmonella enterica subsp. enterica serovar Anatum]|nr:autotransporter-associated beta strand repeat-containing protein [Salmonella enterica subsp. enterica serovar Anatum]